MVACGEDKRASSTPNGTGPIEASMKILRQDARLAGCSRLGSLNVNDIYNLSTIIAKVVWKKLRGSRKLNVPGLRLTNKEPRDNLKI